MRKRNRYSQLIKEIFRSRFQPGMEEVCFNREELMAAAKKLQVKLPKNLGDVIYSFRYRTPMPEAIQATAPEGKEWIILPAGPGKYRFVLRRQFHIRPNPMMAQTKVPNSTPGVVALYALSDEQALLAKLRYNRLIDIFTGVT